jgi:hypothetical protein
MIQIVKPNVPPPPPSPFADVIHPSPFKFLFYFRFLESSMPERFYVPKKVLQIGNSKITRVRERIAKEREREEKKERVGHQSTHNNQDLQIGNSKKLEHMRE